MALSPKYAFRVINALASPQQLETELNRLGVMGWYIVTTTPGLIVLSRVPSQAQL